MGIRKIAVLVLVLGAALSSCDPGQPPENEKILVAVQAGAELGLTPLGLRRAVGLGRDLGAQALQLGLALVELGAQVRRIHAPTDPHVHRRRARSGADGRRSQGTATPPDRLSAKLRHRLTHR